MVRHFVELKATIAALRDSDEQSKKKAIHMLMDVAKFLSVISTMCCWCRLPTYSNRRIIRISSTISHTPLFSFCVFPPDRINPSNWPKSTESWDAPVTLVMSLKSVSNLWMPNLVVPLDVPLSETSRDPFARETFYVC
jgi:hypothetical protein